MNDDFWCLILFGRYRDFNSRSIANTAQRTMIFLALFLISLVRGHIFLSKPAGRTTDSGLKDPYPCGGIAFFQNGHPVTELSPGVQYIEVTETVNHAGAPMRVAISMANDDGFDDHVLLSHVPHADGLGSTPYVQRYLVEIPDVKCDKCSLQVLSIMTDKISSCCEYPSSAPYSCFSVYHTCANIKINGTATSLPASKITDPVATKMWSKGEAAPEAWTKLASGDVVLDKPYPDFAVAGRCKCSGSSCTRDASVVGALITPPKIGGGSSGSTGTTATTPTAGSTTSAATSVSSSSDSSASPSSSSSSSSTPASTGTSPTTGSTTDMSAPSSSSSSIILLTLEVASLSSIFAVLN